MRSLFVFRRALLIAALGISVPFAAACSSSDSSGNTRQDAISVLTLSISPGSDQSIEVGAEQDYTLEIEVRVNGETKTLTTEELADLDAAVADGDFTDDEATAIEDAVSSLVWSVDPSEVAELSAANDGATATATGSEAGDATVTVTYSGGDAGVITDSVELAVTSEGGPDKTDAGPGPGMDDAGAGGAGPGGEDAGSGGDGGSGGGDVDAGMGGGPMGGDPGVVVEAPADGLETSEAGGQDTFTVALESLPSADVTVTIGIAGDEATSSPATLTFTPEDWAAPQTVTVSGEDDEEADGDQDFVVTLSLTSSDAGYDGLAVDGVEGVNVDDESSSIQVTPVSGLETSEAGGFTTFSVSLTKAPTAEVMVPISTVSDEVTLSVTSLAFTPENFNSPKMVTVTGVDDDETDGDQEFSIEVGPATSDDASYNGESGADVLGINLDDERAGFVLSDSTDLVTTEDGGQAVFRLNLLSKPTANVTIALSSSDEEEGTVSPASVIFTPDNFNAPQAVTVTGADDDVKDGDQRYFIVTANAQSADPAYNGEDVADVEVTNTDNDTAGFTVAPADVVVDEDGATAEVTVRLRTQPTADVTIPVSSSDESEVTVSPATLTFTSENWNSTKAVVVTGVSDLAADGDQPFLVVLGAASSADANYDGVDPRDVPGINEDKDSPGFAIVAPDTLLVSEDGSVSDSFTVALDTVPTADVIVSVVVSDASEASVSTTELTFTPANSNGVQTVDVNGVDDAIADGDQPFTVTLSVTSSDDTGYQGLAPQLLPGTNVDVGDTAGILVQAADDLTTFEAPNNPSATFTVRLTSEPSALVTIPLSVPDGEGSVSPSSLTFTGGENGNWDSPRTVTVTGVDDQEIDGDQVYTVRLDPATSAAPEYDGLDGADVTLTNVDDDSAAVVVFKAAGPLLTDEEGGTDQYEISLTSQPTADVVVTLRVADVSDCEIDGDEGPQFRGIPDGCQPEVLFNLGESQTETLVVTFSPEDWDSRKVVPVIGQDDDLKDGQQRARVTFDDVVSTDANYNGIEPESLQVVEIVNTDLGDTPGAIVTEGTRCEFGEGGFLCITDELAATTGFGVRLTAQPTSDVTVTLTQDENNADEYRFGVATELVLTFTPDNWDAVQPVALVGQNDDIEDGNRDFGIDFAYASGDPLYDQVGAPFFVSSVDGRNLDDDTAAIQIGTFNEADVFVVGDPVFSLEEGVGSGLFGIRLATQPESTDTSAVIINVESLNPGQFVLETEPCPANPVLVGPPGAIRTLTFNDGNWDEVQCVRAFAVADDKQDGDITVKITATVDEESDDTVYSDEVAAEEFDAVNVDNDTAGVVLALSDDCEDEDSAISNENGEAACVRLRLDTNPVSSVTVRLDLDFGAAPEGREEASFFDQTPPEVLVEGRGDVDTDFVKFVTFTPDAVGGEDWDAGVLVPIYGINDDFADGNQGYSVKVAVVSGGSATDYAVDPQPAGFFPTVSLVNNDDDSAALDDCISDGADGCDETISIGEDGESQLVEVRLATEPDPSVEFSVTLGGQTGKAHLSLDGVADGGDVLSGISVTSATTLGDGSFGFSFYVIGDNDDIDDSDQPITVTVTPTNVGSNDDAYTAGLAFTLNGTVVDDDSVGFVVASADDTMTESGDTATFSVMLNSEPTEAVLVTIDFDAAGQGQIESFECDGDCDVLVPIQGGIPAISVWFTPDTWDTPQSFVVTGKNDDGDNGDTAFDPLISAVSPEEAGGLGGFYDELDWTNDGDELLVNILDVVVVSDGVDPDSYARALGYLQAQPSESLIKDSVRSATRAELATELEFASVLVVPSLTAVLDDAGQLLAITNFVSAGGTLVLTGDQFGHAFALAAAVRSDASWVAEGAAQTAGVTDDLVELDDANDEAGNAPWTVLQDERAGRPDDAQDVMGVGLRLQSNTYMVQTAGAGATTVFRDLPSPPEGDADVGAAIVAAGVALGKVVYFGYDMITAEATCEDLPFGDLRGQCIGWEYPLDLAVGGYHGGSFVDPPLLDIVMP